MVPLELPCLTHSGTAPGRVGQCCSALAFCIFLCTVFAASSIMLSNDISSLHDSQAFFCTTFKSKYFQKPGTGPCPSEITVMEQPLAAWDSAAVLPFALGIHFPAVMSALQCICIFCNSFWHILVPKTSRLYMKKLL